MSLQVDTERSIQDILAGPKFPDKEFVRSGATFAQVYAMAAWLRTALAGSENAEAAVCLAAENKAIIAAALLASLAGGPTLLLPYAFSTEALARMQQATGFTCAITDVDMDFPQGTQLFRPQVEGTGKISIDTRATSQAELLRIFTGGSTGTPQVWSKTGANVFAEGLFLAHHFAVTENDRIVATIPPYHIYGLLFSIVLPLVSSATVIGEIPSFPAEIVDSVQKQKASILASIPAHYRVLRERPLSAPSLRLAFSSAGMLDVRDNEAFNRKNRVEVVEVYGSTESGGIATRNRSLGEKHFTPFPTVDCRIEEHRLLIRSPYLSPDVPMTMGEKGFFVVGDMVEDCGANSFALKGRVDTVTKVGGKRVDLEEVRSLIKNEPDVVDCVVLPLPEPGGREHKIVALIEGVGVNTDKVRKTLAGSLEAYALPRVMRTINRIPMNENGKYDRAAIVRLFDR